ncbi:hypothetical protein AVEN_85990-1 [Araneus ventricosus]|uniref:Uncharacterized protein n=1 Tax=Araneus ventricosus TaxID=182803 RepID=A0A4Y2C4U3_ARAVE|nr:hypothetical protein AVEN_45428-1 [Araneus ventricosus]GBL99490.1 hypothetical protein AVEN_39321-1 [Araneus ventricosus]GBL99530.1 hypothetical protein AVEN_80594-1 [Araneus ventricosus]GBL99535.1 hypothetical protein AVEN_85990-1 [Araneus ventricosus]
MLVSHGCSTKRKSIRCLSLGYPTEPALPYLLNVNFRLLRFPLERETLTPSPCIYTGLISAFMTRQSKLNCWICNLPLHAGPILIGFHIGDGFWRGTSEFVWSEVVVNVKP